MQINLASLNYLAIVVAALSVFAIGALWYSLLFSRAWMRAAGMTVEETRKGAVPKFGGALLLSVLAAFMLAMFIGKGNGITFGLLAGFFAATGWVAPFLGIFYLFERRSFRHFLVNAGYAIVSLSLMGLIIGAWQ
jgi:hypothetical protein